MSEKIFALVQKEDGYSGTAEGPQLDDANAYLELAQIDMPEPGPGQVVIKVRTAAVNPSDLHFIKGEYGQPRVKGAAAGFEGCGDVVATGKGAEGLMGQRVGFVVGPGGSGAWAEYALTHAIMAVPLAPQITDDDGAGQLVNPMTAMAMIEIAKSAGQALVVSAATSQLGKLMVGLGADLGLDVIALIRRADAKAATLALGAHSVLVTTAPDALDEFAALSVKLKPRVFLDCVGDQFCEQIFCAMPNGARWISYGKLSAEQPKLTQMGQLIFMRKRIEGFWLTQWMQETDPKDQIKVIGQIQQRFVAGQWSTDIAARLPLREAIDGLGQALRIPGGKVLITP